MKYFIKTFGCQMNTADSERVAAQLSALGMAPAAGINEADYIVINTCMVRLSAENRVYGLVKNLNTRNPRPKIILTGCMVGLAVRDESGKLMKSLKKKLLGVDEFMPIEKVGFDIRPLRSNPVQALVPISNGCNNFCSYCAVPYTRGQEVSRPFTEIINECKNLSSQGYTEILLLGQNVNSYGADFLEGQSEVNINGNLIKPVLVKHMGKYRIPTLFPHLLSEVARLGFKRVEFLSSNPWDFSDELIEVISQNKNITRTLHLPVQSGDDEILKEMNRWYTCNEYLSLVKKIRAQIPEIRVTTDIIVGFPGETDARFKNTVKLCKAVGFSKAYISLYSPRVNTKSQRMMADDIPYKIKRQRFNILDKLINQVDLNH